MPDIITNQPGAISESVVRSNKLIRNTYTLLSATLLFSAIAAVVSMYIGFPHLGLFTLVGYIGLLMAVNATRNSAWGLVWIFALTGFMGLTIGPIISFYLAAFSNGAQLVALAMGGTGAIFLGLSGYALVTKKDFSFIGGFLIVGIMVAFIAGLASIFLSIPGLSLAVSMAFIGLMAGMILYETSNLIHRPGMNYIMATVSLYISIYNLFLSLLHLLGALAGNRN
ncbi:MAG: Bax inhibitor-1/YccA family protein [Candidatus Porifericomitaceae bacterium WSBS_2022_MAG_OTU9]